MSRRRIVPDNSVVVPAFFRETLQVANVPLDLTRPAKPLIGAVRTHRVQEFAPELLVVEFVHVARRESHGRDRSGDVEVDQGRVEIDSFLDLPITMIPVKDLAQLAVTLVFEDGISAADCWYVAAAVYADAELWLSHAHTDGLADSARRRGVDVRLLARETFGLS